MVFEWPVVGQKIYDGGGFTATNLPSYLEPHNTKYRHNLLK